MRQFARLTRGAPIPEGTTIMNFRHLLEKHQLAAGILEAIKAYPQDKRLSLRQGMIVHAPSSTKNNEGKRGPETHQTKNYNQFVFGMKAHISADAESGLVHHVPGTTANAVDVTEFANLLHSAESDACADAGYAGVEKITEHECRPVIWQIAALSSNYKHLANAERSTKPSARSKRPRRSTCESGAPLSVIKRQFGYVKTRFRVLAKNTAQLTTLFALSNL